MKARRPLHLARLCVAAVCTVWLASGYPARYVLAVLLAFAVVVWLDTDPVGKLARTAALALAVWSHGPQPGKNADRCFPARAAHFLRYMRFGANPNPLSTNKGAGNAPHADTEPEGAVTDTMGQPARVCPKGGIAQIGQSYLDAPNKWEVSCTACGFVSVVTGDRWEADDWAARHMRTGLKDGDDG